MRTLLLLVLAFSLSSCSVWNSVFKKAPSSAEAVEIPTDLEGPAYDPASSPVPMTQGTVLPQPAGTTQPAAYGNAPQAPESYGSAQPQAYGSAPEDPAAYPPASTPLGPVVTAKGEAAPSTYAPQTPAGIALAATLSGLWVNSADPKEVVEFTPDHYTTFYDGEMLFQEPMTYHPNCPGDCNGGAPMEIACFTISGPGGTDCYGIIRMTPDVLEMSLLGVSTETIVYRKQ